MNDNRETFDASYSERPINSNASTNGSYHYKAKKQKKSHPIITVALSTLLGLGAGVGGSYFVLNEYKNSEDGATVVYKSDATGTSTETSASGASTGMTTTEVAAKAAPSVVEILTSTTTTSYGMFGGTYTSQAAGSGVIISSDGYIITNNHVVEDADAIQITLYDGTVYEATLVGTDSTSDIAVLKVDANGLTAATLGDSSTIQAGDTAVAIGNPLGTLGGTVTDGIISATNREITMDNETYELIQTNCAINSGNSGGGLFDGNGNLIGIVNMKDSGTTSSGTVIEGLGFAIPINTAMDVAQQLIENGKVTNRAALGIYTQTLTTGNNQYPAGIYITGVVSGSGAEEAGLQAYDRILSIDGNEVEDSTSLSAYIKSKSVGDTVTLVVSRNGQEISIDVVLSSSAETTNG